MTIGALKRQTSNFLFNIVNFDFGRWHSYEHENWDNVDAILAAFITGTGLKGLWRNSTIYATSDRVIDPDTSDIYLCLAPHTSAATPTTFSADRVANPTYWRTVAYEPQHRGQWLTATVYGEADFVSDAGRYGYVTVDYLSGASYDADVAGGKIETLIDLANDPVMLGKVNKSGDTMTGNLLIQKGSPGTRYYDTSGAANTRQFGTHSESNTFTINAYNDAGVWQRVVAAWDHVTGKLTSAFTAEFNAVIAKGTWPGYEFWDTDAAAGSKRSLLKYADKELVFIRQDDAGAITDYPFSVSPAGVFIPAFGFDASTDSRVRGVLAVQRTVGGYSRITSDGSTTRTGWYEWKRNDNSRVAYFGYVLDGDNAVDLNFDTVGGVVRVGNGSFDPFWGIKGRAGAGGAVANYYNIYWTGSVAQLWIDNSNQGNLVTFQNSYGQQGLSKGWGHTNAAGTAYNDSSNMSSLTDVGTGEFVYNFTSAMANAVYPFSSAASMPSGYTSVMCEAHAIANRGASAIRWRTYRGNTDVLTDMGGGGIIHGDQ